MSILGLLTLNANMSHEICILTYAGHHQCARFTQEAGNLLENKAISLCMMQSLVATGAFVI